MSLFLLCLIYITTAYRGSRNGLEHRWINTKTRIAQRQKAYELLKVSRHKWDAINKGFYHYQFQKTCDCEECKSQAMNVYVEQNVAVKSEFAEGNKYALANFCSSNNETLNRQLMDSLTSIDDVFEMISLVLMDHLIEIQYDDEIGIPLSIVINGTFVSINCIQFDEYPKIDNSPNANANNIKTRIMRNNLFTTNIDEFNAADTHSCANINVPSECDDADSCNRYSDGCNTCSCDESTKTMHCTKRVCDAPILKEFECIDDDDETPQNDQNQSNKLDTILQIFSSVGPWSCVEHCLIYFNGCNACNCEDSNAVPVCTSLSCNVDSVLISERKCFKCEDAKMEYTKCGKCTRTCDNPTPSCLNNDECIEKCQCPLSAPIYDNGKCITAEECNNIVTIIHNDTYEVPLSNESFVMIEEKSMNIGDHIRLDNTYRRQSDWTKHFIFSLLFTVCVVTMFLLPFWKLYRNKMLNLKTQEESDVEHKVETEMKEDAYAYNTERSYETTDMDTSSDVCDHDNIEIHKDEHVEIREIVKVPIQPDEAIVSDLVYYTDSGSDREQLP